MLLLGRRDLFFLRPRTRRALALSITVVGMSHHRSTAATVANTLGAISGSGGHDGHESTGCRVAVLYSGHVRSFAHPRIHRTHMENLIAPLKVECDVNVFMYLAGEKRLGHLIWYRSTALVVTCAPNPYLITPWGSFSVKMVINRRKRYRSTTPNLARQGETLDTTPYHPCHSQRAASAVYGNKKYRKS